MQPRAVSQFAAPSADPRLRNQQLDLMQAFGASQGRPRTAQMPGRGRWQTDKMDALTVGDAVKAEQLAARLRSARQFRPTSCRGKLSIAAILGSFKPSETQLAQRPTPSTGAVRRAIHGRRWRSRAPRQGQAPRS